MDTGIDPAVASMVPGKEGRLPSSYHLQKGSRLLHVLGSAILGECENQGLGGVGLEGSACYASKLDHAVRWDEWHSSSRKAIGGPWPFRLWQDDAFVLPCRRGDANKVRRDGLSKQASHSSEQAQKNSGLRPSRRCLAS